MKIHALGGMPRSGSTLLCNILAQNPELDVSSTSHVPNALGNLASVHSQSMEVRSALIRDRQDTEDRLKTSMRNYVTGWYRDAHITHTVIDKSRLWNHHADLFRWVFPDAKLVLMVRDIRGVVSSVEKQHLATIGFDEAKDLVSRTLVNRLDGMLAPTGVVGRAIMGIEDVLVRQTDCLVIKYEDFVRGPELQLKGFYEHVGMEPFDHDLENVENRAEDVDALYLHKFPHDASGPVRKRGIQERENWGLGDGLAQKVWESFPVYNRILKYER